MVKRAVAREILTHMDKAIAKEDWNGVRAARDELARRVV